MIFKLWHKLVLTMIGITGIVLILALFISDQSVKKGFLSYINQVEENRLNNLAEDLIEEYQVNNNWDFIHNFNGQWARYSKSAKSPQKNDDQFKAPPILNELATRSGEEGEGSEFPQRPPRPPKQRPGSEPAFGNIKNANDEQRNGPPNRPPRNERRREGQRNPPGNRPPLPKGLVLLDTNKKVIVGAEKANTKPSSDHLKALNLNGENIGYLQFEPFTNFTDELDKQFIQYQSNAFLKIALLTLTIIFIGAALLAAYLRSRINRIGEHARLLTSGVFLQQKLDKSKDELGQLSHKLSVLGKTLEKNQIDRRRWVSDISHELRTPVAVLQGEIEAIQDGIREMNNESVNSLHNETLRLSRLVTDLHQLSLSDSGALNYEKQSLDLVELTKGILASHQIKLDAKNIAVNFNASEKEIIILADAQRLEQLFSNLANNSLHYTRESGQLNISLSKQKKGIIVEWSDSEPGVTDDELAKLFERLYRVEESRNRNAGGSGLGLSICKNIIEAHEGSIIAKHSPLGGITFMITFPYA